MKKALALILTLAMVLSMAACGGQEQTTAAPTQPQTTAAPTEAPTTKAPETTEAPTTEPAPEMKVEGTIYVLNSALEGLETYTDEAVRYNANWIPIKGWNIGNFADKHLWFKLADDQQVGIVSYDDGYTAVQEYGYKTFRDQMFCLDVPEEELENHDSGIVYGPDMKIDTLPYWIGYIVMGPEAFLFADDGGTNAETMFFGTVGGLGGKDGMTKMVDAESYDFIGIDGYTEEIDKEDLKDVNIYFNEGRVDADSIAWKGYTITDIQYIVPHGVDKDNLPETEENTVYKITVVNSGVLDVTEKSDNSYKTALSETDAEILFPNKGSAQVGYKVTEILKALELDGYKSVTTISSGDSASVTCTFDEFKERYIVENDSKDRGPYTTGKNQARGEMTTNVLLFAMDNDAMVYVPQTATQEAGVPVGDLLEKLGVTDAKAINVICNDGYNEIIDAEDIKDVFIFHLEDRIDVTSIAYTGYTLKNAVKIEILK